MQPTSQTTNFYTHMLRNLNVLRDVQRIIFEARRRKQNSIIFCDENGERWMLKKIPEQKQSPASAGRLYT